MKKIFILLLLMTVQVVMAQAQKISGKVTDSKTGEGLPSVSVMLKGTKTGTTSNAKGEFSLSADKKNGSLIVTLIGYTVKEVSIGNQTNIEIQLDEDTQTLNEVEVVAIGYGDGISRRDLTSSVSSVGSKQLKDIPITNAAEALTGRLAGVRELPQKVLRVLTFRFVYVVVGQSHKITLQYM